MTINVFVSSTFDDLHEERQSIVRVLNKMDCRPIGMELFGALDDEVWTGIEKKIAECDYFLVVVAGRYGSMGVDGVSFTEREYRLALNLGKPVLGFVHRDIGLLASNRCD